MRRSFLVVVEKDDSINQQSAELSWTPTTHTTYSSSAEHARVMSDGSAGVLELLPEMLHKRIASEHPQYGLWWHHGSSQVNAQLVSCVNMPSADVYLGLMMSEDTVAIEDTPSRLMISTLIRPAEDRPVSMTR